MNKPHKHAALIKAWADDTSLVIQCRPTRCGRLFTQWADISELETITWDEDIEYRIKPKTIKFRNFLWKTQMEEICVGVTAQGDVPHNFVKWLGEWQEIEV